MYEPDPQPLPIPCNGHLLATRVHIKWDDSYPSYESMPTLVRVVTMPPGGPWPFSTGDLLQVEEFSPVTVRRLEASYVVVHPERVLAVIPQPSVAEEVSDLVDGWIESGEDAVVARRQRR